MVGAALVKAIYALPTWTRTSRLIAEHTTLREFIGGAPSHWACYRFAVKLREHGDMLTACIDRVLATLHAAHPQMGEIVAIHGSDLPAYANGQRYVSRGGKLRERFSDPDATWGHRSSISTRSGGGYYGYKVHAAVCTATGLPVAWQVETVYEDVEGRHMRPVIPLRETPAVKAGKHNPPSSEHGEWTFAGSDAKRGASKWRCPSGECNPASVRVKASRLHTLIPRGTDRWKGLYHQRDAVEREFGVLKHQWGALPLRVRRLPRVRLHVDLAILAQLADAVTRTDIKQAA